MVTLKKKAWNSVTEGQLNMKINIHIKKIDCKYVKHWLRCTIGEIPSAIWYLIRFHYIALIAMSTSTYILFFKAPYGDSFTWFIVGFIILVFGMGFDMRNNTTGIY